MLPAVLIRRGNPGGRPGATPRDYADVGGFCIVDATVEGPTTGRRGEKFPPCLLAVRRHKRGAAAREIGGMEVTTERDEGILTAHDGGRIDGMAVTGFD